MRVRTWQVAAVLGVVAVVGGAIWVQRTSRSVQVEQDAAATDAGVSGVPKIVADKTTHDFGRAYQGAPLEHVFVVRNAGHGELIIERAQGS